MSAGKRKIIAIFTNFSLPLVKCFLKFKVVGTSKIEGSQMCANAVCILSNSHRGHGCSNHSFRYHSAPTFGFLSSCPCCYLHCASQENSQLRHPIHEFSNDFVEISLEEPCALWSNGSFHLDPRSEVIKLRPESSLPLKKRRAQFTDTFLAKVSAVGESTNMCPDLSTEGSVTQFVKMDSFPSSNCFLEKFPVSQPYMLMQPCTALSNNLTARQWNDIHVSEWALRTLDKINASHCKKDQVLQRLQGIDGEQEVSEFSNEDRRVVSENLGPVLLKALSQTIEETLKCKMTHKSHEKKKRTRKRGSQCVGQLWEFMFRMLQNPETNPSVICWEDETQRLFRIVDTEKLAHLWGKRKGKPYLTYANMSRTMRYYREGNGAFVPDDRKRVYGFGPKANIDKLKKINVS